VVQLSKPTEVQRPPARVPAPRVVVGGVLLAGLIAIVLARHWTGNGYVPAPFGLPDPGVYTSVGLPIAQFVHDVAGVAVVGLLFVGVACLRGTWGPAHEHVFAMAAGWAWVWAGSTFGWIVLTLSDLTGLPLAALGTRADAILLLVGTDRFMAEFATFWVALAIALFGARLRRPSFALVTLVVATAALLPSALTGHSGHHANTEIAQLSLGVHLVAAAFWVGGLLALVVHLRPFPGELRAALPRFSTAALVCALAVGLSGVVESVVLLEGWDALWHTSRGQLIVAKTVALVVLVTIGYWHRRRTVPAAADGRLAPLLRLAAGELVLMGAVVGVAVVLSTTAGI